MSKDTRLHFLLAWLLVFVAACNAPDPQTSRSLSSGGVQSEASQEAFFSPNGGVKDSIVAALAATKSRLDIAMYSLRDDDMERAMVEAARRGVRVRVLLHDARSCKSPCLAWEDAGIEVRYVTPVMHHKFMLADFDPATGPDTESLLATGSANWTVTSDEEYDEFWLEFRERPDLFSAFAEEFAYLWSNSRAYPSSSPEALTPIPEASRQLVADLRFTSFNFSAFGEPGLRRFRRQNVSRVAAETLEHAIRHEARHSIQIATTHFRRIDLYEALASALARGVQIELIVDGQEFRGTHADSESTLHLEERLASLGADVRYKYYMVNWNFFQAKQMHSKYMIVDGRTVFAGSYNWSESAETHTFENLQRLTDLGVVEAFSNNFAQIKTYGQGGLPDLIRAVQAQNGAGPRSFAPITLTPSEICQLWRLYGSHKHRPCVH